MNIKVSLDSAELSDQLINIEDGVLELKASFEENDQLVTSDFGEVTYINSGVSGVKGEAETEYRTGNVNLTKEDIGLGNVSNLSDEDKPLSNATIDALKNKQDILIAGKNITIEGNTINAADSAATWEDLNNKPFQTLSTDEFLVDESGKLKIYTTNDAEQDNTKPITSAGVYTVVGNIDALLKVI